jgi:hypothetical protein
MNAFTRGFTYAFHRNIGWQDRTVRTVIGIGATIGAIYFFKTSLVYTTLLLILAVAQFFTVAMARCIICFFMGRCTIGAIEKKSLESKGIPFEK